jgi:hypothetical protein
MNLPRKIIQITLSEPQYIGQAIMVFGLCNDGTIWYKDDPKDEWKEYITSNLPQLEGECSTAS